MTPLTKQHCSSGPICFANVCALVVVVRHCGGEGAAVRWLITPPSSGYAEWDGGVMADILYFHNNCPPPPQHLPLIIHKTSGAPINHQDPPPHQIFEQLLCLQMNTVVNVAQFSCALK